MSMKFSTTSFQLQSRSATSLSASRHSSIFSMPKASSKSATKSSKGSAAGSKLTNTKPAQVAVPSRRRRQLSKSKPLTFFMKGTPRRWPLRS